MPIITALRLQTKNKERVNVYLDDAYGLSVQLNVAMTLRRGQELSEGTLAALRKEDGAERAYDRALNFLSYRPRSEREVRAYLAQRDLQDEAIERIVERLKRARLVDDDAFARYWVDNRTQFRPRGAWALRSELRQKGVADGIIEHVLSALDEEASAMQAAQKHLRRFQGLDEEMFRRRLLSFLQRRGFGYQIANQIVDRCQSQRQEQQETNPD
jgi:regulatory protein